MKSGYESLSWVNDKDGEEYVCYFDNSDSSRSFEQLSEEDQRRCTNVNQIVGTERW